MLLSPFRRALAAASVGAALLAVPPLAAGENGAPSSRAALAVDPARQVYAFDDPAILVRQIVFGLAHGVTLLARACLDVDEETRRPTRVAYEEWLTRYGDRIIDSEQVLARHYFGGRAAEAGEDDIARALNLPPQLDMLSTPDRLRAACASFPEALARKRYNLDLVFTTHRDEHRLGRAAELRAGVAQCRQIAAAESLAAIDAALARWEAANHEVEMASRVRWLKFRGDETELRRWQESIAAGARRRLLSDPAGNDSACRQLIAELPSASSTLAKLMGDTSADAETAGTAGTASDAPPPGAADASSTPLASPGS